MPRYLFYNEFYKKNNNVSFIDDYVKNPEKTYAKIYDVSELVKIPEINNGFCKKSEITNFVDNHTLIHLFIKNNRLDVGDIIYIGDSKFVFVIDDIDHTFIYGDDPPYIIFQHIDYLDIIKNKNISYYNVFNKITQSNLNYLFFGGNHDNIIKDYQKHNLLGKL